MQVCRYAKMTRRGWLDEGKQTEDRQRREACVRSACSSNAGVRAGPSRQVSDGLLVVGIVQGAVDRCDRNHCASTRSDQMSRRYFK